MTPTVPVLLRSTFLLALLAVTGQAACFDPGCENTVLRDVPSPDAQRHAVVFERNCGATTGFSTQVSVVPNVRDARGSGNVFSADTDHGKAASGPGGGPLVTVRWVDRRTLEIAYDSAARVFGHETRVDDTDIRYLLTASLATDMRLAGCYRLRWHSDASNGSSSAFSALPAQFELLTVSSPAPFPGYAVHPPALWPESGMPALWMPLDSHTDSLSISWTTGFHGVELRVSPHGDSLIGYAWPTSDDHLRGAAPPPTADVVAVRVPCT